MRLQLKKLDSDLEKNIGENKKLSELILMLNNQIEMLDLQKENLENNLQKEREHK